MSNERVEKIRNIIQREFEKELNDRENFICEVQECIQKAQRQLKILKFAASYGYYMTGKCIKTDDSEPAEYAIHPCVKNLIPGKPESDPDVEPTNVCLSKPVIKREELRKNVDVVRGTFKIKHRFVIGNVSKFIPMEVREDEATHKWMVYIRDKDKDADLQKIIKKVRYFLHESYKPHDIIDVTTCPFHLSRRGWGEFPIRVQIHFKHDSNRPLDIVHPLKLDMTNSGAQRLGCETVVDVYLIHDEIETQSGEVSVKQSKNEPEIESYINIEHNYFSNYKTETNVVNDTRNFEMGGSLTTSQTECQILVRCKSTGEDYFQNVLQRLTNLGFFTTEAYVKWLLNLWPIITESARIWEYKEIHRYSVVSSCEFAQYNIGKQRACEWHRASLIQTMLKRLNIIEWPRKQIFLYSRMHGYCTDYGEKRFTKKDLVSLSSYTNEVNKSCDFRSLEVQLPTDEIIDIVNNLNQESKKSSPVKNKVTWHETQPIIESIVILGRQIGVKFGDEEIIPGVVSNVSCQILAKICQLFAQDLIRKSYCNAWIRNSIKSPGSLEVSDVVRTILESPELDILTNAGLGSKVNNQ